MSKRYIDNEAYGQDAAIQNAYPHWRNHEHTSSTARHLKLQTGGNHLFFQRSATHAALMLAQREDWWAHQDQILGSSICACKTLLVRLKVHPLHALQTSAFLCKSCLFGMWLNMRIQRSAFSSNAFIPASLQNIQPISKDILDLGMRLLPGSK